MIRRTSLAVLLIAASFSQLGSAIAQEAAAGPVNLDALQWSDLPGGVKVAIFMGNPKEPGPYAGRAKLPPRWRIAPHTHPEEGRVATVISGRLYWAIGEEFDESKLQELGPGSVIIEPKGVPHYAMTKDEAVELQVSAIGPAGTKFLNESR